MLSSTVVIQATPNFLLLQLLNSSSILALSPLDPYLSRLHLPSAFSPLSPKVQGPLSINPHPDRKPSPAQRKLLLLRFPPIYPHVKLRNIRKHRDIPSCFDCIAYYLAIPDQSEVRRETTSDRLAPHQIPVFHLKKINGDEWTLSLSLQCQKDRLEP